MQTASMRQTLSEMEHYLEVLASNRQQAQLDLERTQIKAPCDGKVLTINYQEGEFVSAGAPALVLEKYERYLDVYMPETKALQYQPGQQVSLTRAVDHKVFTGVIRYLNPAPSYADLRMSREQGQAELDAYIARMYGLTREELHYILDPADAMNDPTFPSVTFPGLKNKELKLYGEYRTQRLVLKAFDELEAGILK